MLHILASTSLLLNTADGYQSLFHYIPIVLYGINVWQIRWLFQNGYFVTFKECSRSFRLIEWHKIMHKGISLLWKHKAFTLVCISQSSQSTPCRVWRKQKSEYHAKCIQATVKSPVSVCEAISSRCISHQRKVNGNIDSAKYQSDKSVILKYYVNALCPNRRDISLYMISRHAISLNGLEHSKNVKEYPFWND